MTALNKEVPIAELKIGDICRVFNGPWGTAIVQRHDNGEVYFYRPYGHASLSCVYAGHRLICYSGLEEFSRPISDKSTVFVYDRPDDSQFEISLRLEKQLHETKDKLESLRQAIA